MLDLCERLPPQERNALLILFSEENQRLKLQIGNQQQTINRLTVELQKLTNEHDMNDDNRPT